MNINLEQIDELRKRAKVSYEDAKKALEAANGDMVEALIYLEREKKTKFNCENEENGFENLANAIKKLSIKGNNTKLIIKKKDSVVLSLPVTIVVVITIFAPYISLGGLILALVTGYRIRFQGKNGEDMNVNKHFDKAADYVDTIKKDLKEEAPASDKTL